MLRTKTMIYLVQLKKFLPATKTENAILPEIHTAIAIPLGETPVGIMAEIPVEIITEIPVGIITETPVEIITEIPVEIMGGILVHPPQTTVPLANRDPATKITGMMTIMIGCNQPHKS
jgi:hypothetical protein